MMLYKNLAPKEAGGVSHVGSNGVAACCETITDFGARPSGKTVRVDWIRLDDGRIWMCVYNNGRRMASLSLTEEMIAAVQSLLCGATEESVT